MTTHCDEMLIAFGPVQEVLIRIEHRADGWTCFVRHRHLAGLFQDCPASEYNDLSDGELADVLDASLAGFSAYRLW